MMTNYRSRLAPAFLVAASAMLAACSTTPADPAPQALASTTEHVAPTATDSEVTTLADNDDGIRCRRVTNTGTHMYKRVCTTAAQRQKLKEEAARLARGSQMAMDAARNQAAAARSVGRTVVVR